MSNRNDEPLESQVRILFGKSGGKCSYPDCGDALVFASRSRGDLPRNVGKVAHICAASPGGPRYDPTMTREERRAESNLMLLCGSHHDAIDYQLEFHTREWLTQAKLQHESTVARAIQYAMGSIGYGELELVCRGVSMTEPATAGEDRIDPLTLAIDIEEKLHLNELGDTVRTQVELGMAQEAEVGRFLSSMEQILPRLSDNLVAKFKALYYQGISEGLHGDALFGSIVGAAMLNCGTALTAEIEAAALAVVVHLFVICEIFEHERSAAR